MRVVNVGKCRVVVQFGFPRTGVGSATRGYKPIQRGRQPSRYADRKGSYEVAKRYSDVVSCLLIKSANKGTANEYLPCLFL